MLHGPLVVLYTQLILGMFDHFTLAFRLENTAAYECKQLILALKTILVMLTTCEKFSCVHICIWLTPYFVL